MVSMPRVRFGLFDFHTETGELRREGHAAHLAAQPAKVLALLITAGGEVVTREALRDAIWNQGAPADFDRSLNFAIAQVRTALGDSADAPVFIRTVPKRGYQFLAPVTEAAPNGVTVPPPPRAMPSRRRMTGIALGGGAAATVLIAGAYSYWGWPGKTPRIAVARFQNETGNPGFDRLADTVTDLVVAGLTTQTSGRYGIIGNVPMLRQHRSFQDVDAIGAKLGAKFVILGQVQQRGSRIRVLAHLIRLPEGTHLQVSRQEMDEPAVPSEADLAARIVTTFVARLS